MRKGTYEAWMVWDRSEDEFVTHGFCFKEDAEEWAIDMGDTLDVVRVRVTVEEIVAESE